MIASALGRLLSGVLLSGALASGCYLSTGWSEPSPPARPGTDAGITPPPRPLDAGARPDAGPIPPSCVEASVDFACTDTGNGSVPVGVSSLLPVYFGDGMGCFCGEQIRCSGVATEDGVLELTSYECSELLCDGCFPFVRGECELPPLSEGIWHVRVNGADAFELRASDAVPGVGPVDRCATVPRDTVGCGLGWPPRPEPVDQICVANEPVAGQPIAVHVTDFCHGCGDSSGPCEVTRTANTIHVQPLVLPTVCDIDCLEPCSFDESTCFIGPLEAGTYEVTVDGLDGSLPIHVVDAGSVPRPGDGCISVPED